MAKHRNTISRISLCDKVQKHSPCSRPNTNT